MEIALFVAVVSWCAVAYVCYQTDKQNESLRTANDFLRRTIYEQGERIRAKDEVIDALCIQSRQGWRKPDPQLEQDFNRAFGAVEIWEDVIGD